METALMSLVMCLLLNRASAPILESRKPPVFTEVEKRSKIYFKKSGDIQLPCKATGTPNPRYKWHRNGVDYNPGTELNQLSGDLHFLTIQKNDEGKYRCLATVKYTNNNKPDTMAVAVTGITELIFSEIIPGSFDADVQEIHSDNTYAYLSLPCEPIDKAVGKDINKRWVIDSGNKNVESTNRIYIDLNGTLHFLSLDRGDSKIGAYRCFVSDGNIPDGGFLLRKHAVTVQEYIAQDQGVMPILRYKTTKKFALHTDAILECVFSGYDRSQPIPTTTWKDQDDQMISNSLLGKYELVAGSYNRKLLIKNVSESDEKTFYCIGENTISTSDKEAVKLDIMSAPIFTKRPQYQTVVEGNDAVFYCDARSTKDETVPDPPIWYINGKKTWSDSRNNIVISNDKKCMTVKNVNKETDILCVQCSVKNEYGSSWANGCLTVISGIPMLLSTLGYNFTTSQGTKTALAVPITSTTTTETPTTTTKKTVKKKANRVTDKDTGWPLWAIIANIVTAVLNILVVIIIVVLMRRYQTMKAEEDDLLNESVYDSELTSRDGDTESPQSESDG